MRSVAFALGLIPALLAVQAQARDWTVAVGAKVNSTPPYEGADNYVLRVSPTLSARPADKPYRFSPPDGGTSFALLSTDHFELGPMARFRHSRKADDELIGLQKVKWAAEPGGFLDVWPTKWLRLHGEARKGVAGHKGVVGDVGFDLVYTGERWDMSVGPRTGWGDKKYLDKYFGVTAAEAAASPFIDAAYEPGGGRRYTGVALGAAYRLNSRFTLRGSAGYQQLAEKPGDSPIIEIGGSRNQYFGSLGLSYNFNLGL